MGRTVIVSEETLRALVCGHGALAAWYHEFVRASRDQTPAMTPNEETRKSFITALAHELPELASFVATVDSAPVYVPPPVAFAPTRGAAPHAEPIAAPAEVWPPRVDPSAVKY